MNPKKLELIAALKQAATAADAVVKRLKVEGQDTVTAADFKVAMAMTKAAIPGLILDLIEDAERSRIELNAYQLRALLEMAEASDTPEEDPIVICMGGEGCHSGAGLYAYWRECPEEGAEFIGENEEDQQRGNQLAEQFEASQEVQP